MPAKPEELLERFRALALADAKRTAEFRRKNEHERRKSKPRHQEYRDWAQKLSEEQPKLRGATPHGLAKALWDKRKRQGKVRPSIRTFERAFTSKKV